MILKRIKFFFYSMCQHTLCAFDIENYEAMLMIASCLLNAVSKKTEAFVCVCMYIAKRFTLIQFEAPSFSS